MWNGLRGGLVAPASAMEVVRADPAGVLALWKEHGADPELVKGDAYYAYRRSAERPALRVQALATCGRNLTRTPVLRVQFADRRGRLILSQLLTAGRLAPGFGQPGLYGLRYDPAAAQLVLNMLADGLPDLPTTSDARAR
jgi:hypothetical protein